MEFSRLISVVPEYHQAGNVPILIKPYISYPLNRFTISLGQAKSIRPHRHGEEQLTCVIDNPFPWAAQLTFAEQVYHMVTMD
jgi:hypothetical protein